jgi:P4 family phage/plasmid primase-like protien
MSESSCKVKNSPQDALSFLRLLGDDWGQRLHSFDQGRKDLKNETIFVGGADALADSDVVDEITAWLNARHAAGQNIYYALNPILPSLPRERKATKADVAKVSWFHADIDPKDENLAGPVEGQSERIQKETARLNELVTSEERLKALGIAPGLPTIDVSSGGRGGRQLLWKLAAPMETAGQEAIIALVESHTRAIETALTGSAKCFNIDRVLRLPGTVNFPNAKKKKQGAQIALASLVSHHPEIAPPPMYFPRLRADETLADTAQGAEGIAQGAAKPAKKEWCKAEPIDGVPTDPLELAGYLEKWGVALRTVERICFGGNEDEPKMYDSRSENMFGVCRELARKGVPDDVIITLITNEAYAISGHVLDPEKNKQHKGPVHYAQRQVTRAKAANAKSAAEEAKAADAEKPAQAQKAADAGECGKPPAGDDGDGSRPLKPIFNKGAYSEMARAYRDRVRPTILVGPSGEFLAWEGACYRPIDAAMVDHEIHIFLEGSRLRIPRGRGTTVIDTVDVLDTKTVNETRNALTRIQTISADKLDLPCWLKREKGDLPANEIISFPNGLLHVPSGTMLPPTPRFFTRNALEFSYDPEAPKPTRFLQFLRETWGEDLSCVQLAQEWAGYTLIPDNSHHKILVLTGVQRGGKGTYAHILESLVGKTNTSWPEANDLGEKFGGEALIGKSLAIVPEFDLDRTTPVKRIISRLKSYAGGDSFSVQRKNKQNWEGRPSTRVVILSNNVLSLPEASGAMAGRFMPLPIENSVFGKEDTKLGEKLKAELPGILLWAIEGWKQLKERGSFILGDASKYELDKISRSSSPLLGFMEDTFTFDPRDKTAFTPRSALYPVYQRWAKANGYGVMGMQAFCNALEAATGRQLKLSRPAGKERGFVGVTITDDCQPKDDLSGYEDNFSKMSPSMKFEMDLDNHNNRVRPAINGAAYDPPS